MEHKLWSKIFALLLLGLSALALHDNATSPQSTAAPETPAAPAQALTPGATTAGAKSGPILDESDLVIASNNNTETSPSSGLNDTAEEESLTSSNGTTVTNSSEILDVNVTIPVEATSLPASENQTSATQSQQTTASTTLSTTNKTETLSPPSSPSHVEINSTSQSEAPVQAFTPTTELAPSTRTSAATTTTTITSATRTTTSAASPTTSTTTTAATTTTATALESTRASTAKEKTTHLQSDAASHKAITPSQLNVGEETTVVHEGPTLDPLLAGLVSAFIIAAVIITLLLFLKLRRRDSRPEFRRLQDLPMDDMMEDTPLSMYSY